MTLEQLKFEAEHELFSHIYPFWNKLRDERGGFYSYVDYDLTLDREADKGVILNSRILWFYANLYLTTGRDEVKDQASHAWLFLRDYCLDSRYGGVFWSVHADGSPAETIKHTYNQAFAIYALSSWYRASGDEEVITLARQLFHLIETKCTDTYGYQDAFDRQWQPITNDQLSEDGYQADKTMNTLLHVIEAYTELYLAGHDPDVADSLRHALRQCIDQVYSPKDRMLQVFFDTKMNSIADLYSYGHDIEATWLMDRAADALADKELAAEIAEMNRVLTAHVLEEAFDQTALNNQRCRGVVDQDRIWWVEAEGVVGFLNAWQHDGLDIYRDVTLKLWQYIRDNLVDKRPGGEWYSSVHVSNEPSAKPIVEPWKCPYHNGRMCMEVIRRCGEI